MESVEPETRAMKREVSNNTFNVEKMQLKVALLEDQDRRNNVRIMGILNSREEGDAIAFLQDMLPNGSPLSATPRFKLSMLIGSAVTRATARLP